jgi:hypothetical protein
MLAPLQSGCFHRHLFQAACCPQNQPRPRHPITVTLQHGTWAHSLCLCRLRSPPPRSRGMNTWPSNQALAASTAVTLFSSRFTTMPHLNQKLRHAQRGLTNCIRCSASLHGSSLRRKVGLPCNLLPGSTSSLHSPAQCVMQCGQPPPGKRSSQSTYCRTSLPGTTVHCNNNGYTGSRTFTRAGLPQPGLQHLLCG